MDERIPLLDIEDVLALEAASQGRKKLDYFFPNDQFHLNTRGHAVVARAIADFLVKNNLVPGPGEWLAGRLEQSIRDAPRLETFRSGQIRPRNGVLLAGFGPSGADPLK